MQEGCEGVIEGYADPGMEKVLLKLTLKASGGKPQSVTQAVLPRNLKLTSDYNLSKVGEPASSPGSSKDDLAADDPNQATKWLLGSSDPADVRVETKWTSLLADEDNLTKNMYLRGRIATGLQALSEVLPKWTLKDFVVVHRRNQKGLWKGDAYTKRDFEPLDIIMAPRSSQIKDSHLIHNAHAVVTLPRSGR